MRGLLYIEHKVSFQQNISTYVEEKAIVLVYKYYFLNSWLETVTMDLVTLSLNFRLKLYWLFFTILEINTTHIYLLFFAQYLITSSTMQY